MLMARQIEETENLKIIPFDPKHVMWIKNRNTDGDFAKRNFNLYITAEQIRNFPGIGYTAIERGEALAAAGMIVTRPKIGMVWAYTGDMRGREIWFCKITKAILEDTIGVLGVNRVEDYVHADFTASRKWLRFLGFKNETPEGMKNWGPEGETFYLMARTL